MNLSISSPGLGAVSLRATVQARLDAAIARRTRRPAIPGATFLDRLAFAAAPTPLGPIVFSLSMGWLCCLQISLAA